jgi:hypothetical protein
MQSPMETILRLAKGLGLPTDTVAAAVSGQIDSSMRHHEEPAWPDGEPCEELILSIHQALVSGQGDMEEKLDRLRRAHYSQMGWPG